MVREICVLKKEDTGDSIEAQQVKLLHAMLAFHIGGPVQVQAQISSSGEAPC